LSRPIIHRIANKSTNFSEDLNLPKEIQIE